MTEVRNRRVEKAGQMVHASLLALGVAVAVALAFIVLAQGYQLQKLGGVAADTKRNSDRLVDCTTPGGKCYEQGRSATSGAVGTINRITIAAVYCSGKLGLSATIGDLTACVTAQTK